MKNTFFFIFPITFKCTFIACFVLFVISTTISAWKRCSLHLYLQLYIEGLMSCLRYLYLFAHSDVQHIVLCFCLFPFVLCALCCQFLCIIHFWLSIQYSLTFIHIRSMGVISNLESAYSGLLLDKDKMLFYLSTSCVPYIHVASFSGLFICIAPLVFPNVYYIYIY